MTSIKHKITVCFVLIAGTTAAISAWIEGQKPWVALVILVGTLGLDAILDGLHDSKVPRKGE